jgi:hypothetical protein
MPPRQGLTRLPLLLQPYSKETEDRANSGVVVPLFPFGIRKYDDGERFDLRLPYADDGWVDPDEVGGCCGEHEPAWA